MPEYTVELLLFVEADSYADAEALGKHAAKQTMKATTPRPAAKVLHTVLADVREEEGGSIA